MGKIGKWIYRSNNLRYRLKEGFDCEGNPVTDYEFEIFKKPWFLGFLRSKRWEWAVTTNGYSEGISFCKYLLK